MENPRVMYIQSVYGALQPREDSRLARSATTMSLLSQLDLEIKAEDEPARSRELALQCRGLKQFLLHARTQ